MEQFGARIADPIQTVPQILDDFRQFRFGSEAVIKRHEYESVFPSQLAQLLRHAATTSHDQCTAMKPHDDGALD